MPEVEEVPLKRSVIDLRIWEPNIFPDFKQEIFLRLKRVGNKTVRVILCDEHGDIIGAGNLFGFSPEGKLEVYSSVNKKATDLGMKLEADGSISVKRR